MRLTYYIRVFGRKNRMKYRSFPGEDLRPPYVTKQKTSQAGFQLAPRPVFGAKTQWKRFSERHPFGKR